MPMYDRNISDNAGIMAHKILGTGLHGNIVYASRDGSAFDGYMSSKAQAGVRYFDTIQAAYDSSSIVARRGDVILVGPPGTSSTGRKIIENVVCYNKPMVKIIGTGHSWEMQWRVGDATTKYPYTPNGGTAVGGVGIAILSRSIEVANMFFDNDGGYTGIYVGDGDLLVTGGGLAAAYGNENSAGAWIHDCQFGGGTSSYYGVNAEGSGANLVVERCFFDQQKYSAVHFGSYSSRSNQRSYIRDNEFLAGASGCYGVRVNNIGSNNIDILVARNTFRDGSSKQFTYGVYTESSHAGVTSIVGNSFACANAISAQSTDFCAGNYLYSAGNAPHFVQDSTNSA